MSHIPSDGKGERASWAAVAQVAIDDARAGRDEHWLHSRDADLVLGFAGVDPDAVRSRALTRQAEAVSRRRGRA